jgi:C4-dicarboxylate transporter, DctM subunit
VTGRNIRVDDIFAGVMRFLAMDIVVLAILILVPAISTLIPNGL